MIIFILQESESYYSAPSPNPSVDSSGDGDGKKKRRPKFIRIVDCHVCGDKANDHIHYGAICKFLTTTNKICRFYEAAHSCAQPEKSIQNVCGIKLTITFITEPYIS